MLFELLIINFDSKKKLVSFILYGDVKGEKE